MIRAIFLRVVCLFFKRVLCSQALSPGSLAAIFVHNGHLNSTFVEIEMLADPLLFATNQLFYLLLK